MKAIKMLQKRIEKEETYLETVEPGSDKYNESQERLNRMTELLGQLEQNEREEAHKNGQTKREIKAKKTELIMDVAKFVVGGVIIPVGMSVFILKWEETGSVTTALRSWITNNVPKKFM